MHFWEHNSIKASKSSEKSYIFNKIRLKTIGINRKIKWSQGDSNSWPPACHAGALPAELWPQINFSICYQSVREWITSRNIKFVIFCQLLSSSIMGNNLRKLNSQNIIMKKKDQWIKIMLKKFKLFNGKRWSIRGIKSGK